MREQCPRVEGDFGYDEVKSLEAAGYWRNRGYWQGVKATAAIAFAAGVIVALAITGGSFGHFDCRAPKVEAPR